jgi:hypothetical protein
VAESEISVEEEEEKERKKHTVLWRTLNYGYLLVVDLKRKRQSDMEC